MPFWITKPWVEIVFLKKLLPVTMIVQNAITVMRQQRS
jgi:hypothetical protein